MRLIYTDINTGTGHFHKEIQLLIAIPAIATPP